MLEKKQKSLGHLLGLLTNIAYSFNFIFLKVAVEEGAHPAFIVFVRVLGAFVVFTILFWNKIKTVFTITKNHWFLLLLAGLSGSSLNKITFVEGLKLSSVVHASSITLLFPLFVMAIERVFLKPQKLKMYQYLGICFGLFGTSILVGFAESDKASSLFGDFLVLLNFLLFAAYTVIVRYLTKYYSVQLILFVSFGFGLMVMLGMTLPRWESLHVENISWLGYLNILATVVFASIVAQVFNTHALKYLDASVLSVYIYVQLLGGSFLAILLLGETFTYLHFVSAVFVAFGLYLTSFRDVFQTKKP